jgi:hypothetical protein
MLDAASRLLYSITNDVVSLQFGTWVETRRADIVFRWQHAVYLGEARTLSGHKVQLFATKNIRSREDRPRAWIPSKFDAGTSIDEAKLIAGLS